jgi:glycine/D-amino acid oxidase-like deaminating enzyme
MQMAPKYRSGSGWNALLPPRVAQTVLPKTRRFRNIVVGAGYTGLATARRLAELNPDEPILLLEASTIGEGASGRNSGYLLINPGEPSANAEGFAADWALKQMNIVQAGLDELKKQVYRYSIDCDWDENPLAITAAATPRVEKSARATVATYRNWGIKPREYSPNELAQIIGTKYYRYGLESLTKVLIQPAALHRGLADNLPSSVHLVENIVVQSVSKSSPFCLKTNQGDFIADRVFITNNLHARELGVVRNRMIGILTYGAFTPELDEGELANLGEASKWGILPAHRMGTTMRKTSRRLLIRSGDSYETELAPERARAMLTSLYKNRFPHMRTHEFEFVWGGFTAVTHNGGFYFGEAYPGMFVSVGCGGAGVLRGTSQGVLLADLASGVGSQLLTDRLSMNGPSWIPPEPFAMIGAKLQIAFEELQAGKER